MATKTSTSRTSQTAKLKAFILRNLNLYNTIPISNGLQRTSIFVTIVFTLITGFFAIKTYNTAVTINKMDSLLATVNAATKPLVAIISMDTEETDSVVILNTNYVNLGIRPVETQMFQLWIWYKDSVFSIPPQIIKMTVGNKMELAYSQPLKHNLMDEKRINESKMAIRITYRDLFSGDTSTITQYFLYSDPFTRKHANMLSSTEIEEFKRKTRDWEPEYQLTN